MQRKKLIEISVFRGIASLLVVLFHITATLGLKKYYGVEPLNGLFNFGYSGVDFFFVLSGFIIYYSSYRHFNNPNKIYDYLRKRFIRIYPIYWIVLSILILAILIQNKPLDSERLFFDFLLLPNDQEPYLVVAWSLKFEVLFYFTFILFFINSKTGFLATLLVILFLFLQLFLKSLFFNNHIFEFAIGIFIAYLSISFFKVLKKYNSQFFYLGSILFCLTAYLNHFFLNSPNYNLFYALSSALLILAASVMEMKVKFNSFFMNIALFIGEASYSIYLIHFPLVSFFTKFLLDKIMYVNLALLIEIFLIVLSGLFFYSCLEKPILEKL